jgi:hypothetical protein
VLLVVRKYINNDHGWRSSVADCGYSTGALDTSCCGSWRDHQSSSSTSKSLLKALLLWFVALSWYKTARNERHFSPVLRSNSVESSTRMHPKAFFQKYSATPTSDVVFDHSNIIATMLEVERHSFSVGPYCCGHNPISMCESHSKVLRTLSVSLPILIACGIPIHFG